jgi:hypothetical protein
MGKRSDFPRRPQDAYDTPQEAVLPLLPYLAPGSRFIESCAGSGALVRHLEAAGHVCIDASDIAPRADDIRQADATDWDEYDVWGTSADCFITNPPWERQTLHQLIANLSSQLPTWLLMDAEWMHTKQSVPFLPHLRMVVSVGRIRWIPGSAYTSKDSCAWHLFSQPMPVPPLFMGRKA